MTIEVIGSVYTGKNKDGDFNWMIQQPQYADALFVFNDNEQQYTLHHDHPTAKAGWWKFWASILRCRLVRSSMALK